MAELLGDAGADGAVGTQIKAINDALIGNNGIQKLVETAAGGTQTVANSAVKAKVDALKDAVTKATGAIDAKLESGDLTQLDTSNLKALKSSINDIQSQLESAFTDLGLDINAATGDLAQDKAKELQEVLKTGVVTSNTELGEKAKGIVTSSQNQAETVAEMKNDAESVLHKIK